MINADQLISRYDTMKAEKGTLESHLQECADYVIPRKAQVTRQKTEGAKDSVMLFDTTAPQAAELLAGALHGMLTNPASIWFEFATGDEALDSDDDVRKWLQDSTRRAHDVLNNSNFQTEVHELYVDLGWAGTSCMAIEEDDDFVVRFNTRDIGEICIDEDDKGFIDTVFRKYQWTAKQIVQRYGLKKCGKKVAEAYKKDPQQKFWLLHAVFPRPEGEIKKGVGQKGWPIASQIIIIEDKTELMDGGYREFPYSVPRWTKKSGEKYGRSPAMKALPDIKMINEMMKTTIKAAQKIVDPPLQAPDDGFMLPLRTGPAQVNFYRAGSEDRIVPFGNEGRVDIGYQVMEDVRKRIREAFYVDQLQLAQGPQMTATEVLQRTEEKLKLMGPMLGRQNSEFLRPMIFRVFGIMLRKNKFLPVPDKLKGHPVRVVYTSAVARAQRMSEGQNVLRLVSSIAPFVNTDPTIMDNIDGDGTVRYLAQIFGIPQKMLRDQRVVKKMRDGRQQAQQDAVNTQQQQELADQVAKVGPVAIQAQQQANGGTP